MHDRVHSGDGPVEGVRLDYPVKGWVSAEGGLDPVGPDDLSEARTPDGGDVPAAPVAASDQPDPDQA